MKIIYSLDTNGGENQFTEFWGKLATLSIVSASRITANYNLCLYTDLAGYKLICDLGLRFFFKQIEITNFAKLAPHNREYWNFCKLYTYAQQQEPFLHVDFDVIFENDFTIPTRYGILTEKLRDYNFNKYFNECAINQNLSSPAKLICSGLLGTNGANPLFAEMYEFAKDFCKKPPRSEEFKFAYLVGVEEYNLSCLADFYDVPAIELNKNSYIHFQGANKEKFYGEIINELYKNLNI